MGSNPGMTLQHGVPLDFLDSLSRLHHSRRYIINAKYYEFVNEKKKKFKKEW
jgi:hypothetical protein